MNMRPVIIEAGAAIMHSHTPDTGALPKQAAELYLQHLLPLLDKYPDALLYPTVVYDTKIEDRLGHLSMLKKKAGLL